MLADTLNTCPSHLLRWGRSANVMGQGGKIWSGETWKPWHSQHVSSNSSLPGPARLIQLCLRVHMGTYHDLIFTLFFKWVLHDLIHTWHISLTPSLALQTLPSSLYPSLFESQWGVYLRSSDIVSQGKIFVTLKSIFFLIHTCHPLTRLRNSFTLLAVTHWLSYRVFSH